MGTKTSRKTSVSCFFTCSADKYFHLSNKNGCSQTSCHFVRCRFYEHMNCSEIVIIVILLLFSLWEAVEYTVKADVERIRSQRVCFQDGDNTYVGSMNLPSSKSICHTLKLKVVVRSKIYKKNVVMWMVYLLPFMSFCY